MNNTVVILAAGLGSRMEMATPKQFLVLGNMPVLMHSIDVFYRYDPSIRIVLVLQEAMIPIWKDLTKAYSFSIQHDLVVGGKERFFSVKNALSILEKDGLIAVHDAVRPLVSLSSIQASFNLALEKGSAVPVIKIDDSLRQIIPDGSCAVCRDNFYKVHTPQVFSAKILHMAYDTEFRATFTDDASVVEAFGFPIHLCDSNPENIKITNELDFEWAEFLLQRRESSKSSISNFK